MNRKRIHPIHAVLVAIVLTAIAAHGAGVPGVITTTDGRRLEGAIRWMGVARQYEITLRPSNVVLQLQPRQVRNIEVQAPGELQTAANAVRQNRPDDAIPVLDRLAQSYTMLQWDIPATRWLAEAHLQKGDAAAAVRVSERIVSDRPEAGYASELAVPYWRALLQSERLSRLNTMLDQAMGTGTRDIVARALIMRGDMLRSRGDLRDALKDGYLRVVLLFQGEREVQPEALYKAMRCFEELGQVSYAERMRSELMSSYGSSEYARRIATGG